MGGLRVQNEVILAKSETTYNTDAVPTAGTNAILVRSVSFAPEGLRMIDRGAIRSSIGSLQQIYGGELKRIQFECEVKGSGAAGTAPEIAPLLKACGLAETVNAGTSVVYKPTSTNQSSATIYYYEGGRKLHILTGCRGNATLRAEAGGILLIQFDLVGHWTQPTDASQPSPTYNSQVPKPLIALSGFSINGVSTLTCRSWQWSFNNKLSFSPSMSATDGYGDVIIADRPVSGEAVVETELDSVIDVDALITAGTRFAFASGTIGGTAGNRVAVTTPSSSTYLSNMALGDGEGIRLRTYSMMVDDSTPDQEVSITFT